MNSVTSNEKPPPYWVSALQLVVPEVVDDWQRPPYTLSQLAILAVLDAPDNRLIARDILIWVTKNYSHYRASVMEGKWCKRHDREKYTEEMRKEIFRDDVPFERVLSRHPDIRPESYPNSQETSEMTRRRHDSESERKATSLFNQT